jgi:uncharacterized protein (DUF1501 family)
MQPNRRDLLRLGLGAGSLVAAGAAAPAFLWRSASALATEKGESTKGRILVALYLAGGNDGLNTVVPYKDPEYPKLRPALHLARAPVHKINDRMALHPALDSWSKLLQMGQLAVIQGVGLPRANHSHFDSMNIWFTGRLDPQLDTPGWLARWADIRQARPGGDAPAVHVGVPPLPQALAGSRWQVPSLDRPERFRRRVGLAEANGAPALRKALDQVSADGQAREGSLLDYVQRSTAVTYTSSARLEKVFARGAGSEGYPPSPLAQRLRLIAQIIKAGLHTSIYYTEQPGYDTHIDQAQNHERLLRELGGATRAFLDDLRKAGESKRVLMLLFSEFGRRVVARGNGTDHGSGGPVFLLGDAVKPGLHGPYPDLGDLVDGDLRPVIDFRRVYATVLDRWLGVSGAKVLGAKYQHVAAL